MRSKIYKRLSATALAAIISLSSVPVVPVYAEPETTLEENVEDAIYASGVSIVEEHGVEIEPDWVSFYLHESGDAIKVSYDKESDLYLFEDEIEPGTAVDFKITTPDESSYLDYEGTIDHITEDAYIINVSFTEKSGGSISCGAITLKYAGDSVDVESEIVKEEDFDGSITIEVNGITDVISLTGTTIKPLAVGEASVHITASATKKYAQTELDVPVTVEKKDLGVISSDNVTWKNISKVYDTTKTLSAQATIEGLDEMANGDVINIDVELIADSASAGEKPTTISTYNVTSGGDLYDFTLNTNTNSGPAATISKADASISLDDKEVVYGDDAWKSLTQKNVPSSWGYQWIHATCDIGSSSVQSELDKMDLSQYVNFVVANSDYAPGTIKDAIIFSIDNTNQNFNFTAGGWSDITVKNETQSDNDVWNRIQVNQDESVNVYTDAGIIWAAPGSYIAFKMKNSSDIYDKIIFTVDDEEQIDGVNVPSNASGVLSGNVQLGNTKSHTALSDSDAAADGAQANKIPSKVIKIDRELPVITYQDGLGTYTTADADEFGSLAMVKFRKDGYTATVNVSDKDSGIQAATYRLIKVTSQADTENSIKNAAADYESWSTLPDGGKIEVPGTDEGYWIILVGVKDKVGNAIVASSNGVVIDETKPYITITGIDESIVYQDDVTFSLKAGDSGDDKKSGIEKVKVTAKSGNTEKTLYTWEDNKNTIDISDIVNEGVHEADITVPANTFNNNDVTITIEVEDRSGNSQTVTRAIKIDKTAPVIKVSYDNNNAKNGEYFNQERKMTVSITERNFDPEKTILTITANGKKISAPIEKIKAEGVKLLQERKDSQAGKTVFTDARTNTYVFVLGDGDNIDVDYEIDISSTDEAGNASEGVNYGSSKAGNKFTVDKVAPVLKYDIRNSSGTNVEDKLTVSGLAERDEAGFDRKNFTAAVIVTERNHKENGLAITASGARSTGAVSVNTTGNWENSGDNHKYTVKTFAEDANYTFAAGYTDLAGNTTKLDSRYFTVDGTPPVGSVIITANGNSVSNNDLKSKVAFQIFSNRTIGVRNESNDITSGVQSVSQYLYVPGAETRNEFAIPSVEQLRGMNWSAWNGEIRPNKQAVVFLRVVDRAGNTTYISSKHGVIADDVAPEKPSISIQNMSQTYKDDLYNGDVDFKINVKDPTTNNSYSGIKRVKWTITNNGTLTQEKEETFNASSRKHEYEGNITVKAAQNNSNNVQINVEVEDNAGNVSKSTKQIAIDTTKPTVEISYDNNSPLNGKYFNSARTMTVTFTERNFSPERALVTISINGETKTVPIGELSGYGIRQVRGRSDSQSGRDYQNYTDARTNTYVYSFGADGKTDADYDVTTSITDDAGNKNDSVDYGSSKPKREFTIDEIAPTLKMTFVNGSGKTVSGSTNASSPLYDRQSMGVTANVVERNFSESGLSISASGQNAAGKSVSANTKGSWSSSGDNHDYAVNTFTNDGIYTIYATYTDLAGNSVTYAERYFVVDKTAPTGSIKISGESGDGKTTINSAFEKFYELISFRIFTKKGMTATSTSADETSGVAKVQYYLYVPPVESRGEFKGLSLSEMSSLPWKDWNSVITISPNTQVVIYARVIDKAGNITYLNSKDGIIADDTAPEEPVITIDAKKPDNDIYNTDVPFTITVTDPERGGTYAGLKSVKWTIQKDGATTQSGSYNQELSDPTARKKSITHKETIKAEQNNSNDVKIIVETEDYAGNTSKAQQSIKIDVTKPRIEVVYDRNDPKNDKYYDGTRIATVRVYERNFDQKNIQLITTEKENAKPVISEWTGKSTSKDDDVYTCTVTFKEDDDYTFTVKATDLAGNESEYKRTDEFVIDTQRPVIGVTFDRNNDDAGDIYYRKARTAVVVVKDKNFSEQDFAYKIEGALAGTKVETPSPTKWVHNGDIHSTMLVFEDDADYVFDLLCLDLAGNVSETFHQNKFVIDQTKPSVKITGVTNHSANRGDVAPLVEYADLNFNPDGIEVTLEGASHEKRTVKGEEKVDGRSGSFQMDDFAHTKDVDDIYVLTATVKDLAGNKTSTSVEFSINRFGSVYTFSDETKSALEKYYLPEAEKLTIYETNVDGLRNIGITIGHDGEMTKLTEDDDYTASREKTKKGWTVWTYEVNASNFEKEGLYEVKVESVDAAGNRQDNSLKENPISFAVDKTAPSIVVSGIEDASRYVETSRDISITLSDNIALGGAEVVVNGKTLATFDAEEVKNAGGRLVYTLNGADNWQSVEVVASDMAGNTAKSAPASVFISTNKLRQFYENKPAFYGTIFGTVGGIAALVALLAYKKKKDKKEGKGKTKELDRSDEDSDEL